MRSLKSLFILISLFLLSSCTINNTEIDGEGDVVYTSNITIRTNDFVPEDDFVSVAEYGWDNLDEEMVDYGMVLGYIRFEGTTAWHSLPFSVPFEDDLVNLRFLFDINNFSLVLEGEVPGNNLSNAELFDRDVLRVIAIPPSIIVHGKGIDYQNYDQIKQIYGLDD